MSTSLRASRIIIPILGLAALGLAATLPAAAQCVEGCTAIHTFIGEASGDQFGWVSNRLGDLDGDGIDDLVLTAPTNDAGGNNAGRIYVYSGASGRQIFRVTGQAANWWFGHDATDAGDIDDDGVADLVVGAPFGGAGRAQVRSGVGGALLHTFNGAFGGDQFGSRVAGGGDFDGDGRPDVLIGAPMHDAAGTNAGRAYIYSGADWSLIVAIDGVQSGGNFGSGVAFIGDVSQPPDGRDDIVVGAQNAGSGAVGRAYVFEWDGASARQRFVLAPAGPGFDFGLWFMDGRRDVDADGTPDIYINDYVVNRAHIFSGVDGSLIHELGGDGSGGFGIGRLIDDVDGDGHADALLAAWNSSAGAPNAGKAFVYSGQTGAVLETFTHDVAGAQFGFDANGMGDVDGDGRDDHLITAAWDSAQRGAAYLIAGGIAPPPDPADFDGDGVVGPADLAILLAQWGDCPPDDPCADLDGDGAVGPSDLATLLAAWG